MWSRFAEHLFVAALATMLPVALAGCDVFLALAGGEGLRCHANQACPGQLLCIDHRCTRVATCGHNDDCPHGYYCNAGTWTCVETSAHPADAGTADARASDAGRIDSGSTDTQDRPDRLGDRGPSESGRAESGANDASRERVDLDAWRADASTAVDAPNSDSAVADATCVGFVCDGGCINGRCCSTQNCQLPTSQCQNHFCVGSIVLQQGSGDYLGVSDTMLDSAGSASNLATDSHLRVAAHDWLDTLIRFDLSAIPLGTYVYSSTLRLYVDTWSNAQPIEVRAFEVLRPWDISTVSWANAMSAVPWEVAGCNGVTDRSLDAVATSTIRSDAGYGWRNIDITSATQNWVSNPTANHGVVIKSVNDAGTVMYEFHSSEETTSTELRPKLEIDYVEP